MLKITTILSLIFIVSSVWCACDSCGSECARACGTRRFRACCFNYLRRKRSEGFKMIHSLAEDAKTSQRKSEVPVFLVDNLRMPELSTVRTVRKVHGWFSLENTSVVHHRRVLKRKPPVYHRRYA